MRIGIFGGTFDPVHLGHLRIGREIQERFGLDEVRLVPAAIPPHKEDRGVVDPRDRLEMLRLAVAGVADFSVSPVEIRRPGPSYTIDTIRQFRRETDGNARFCLLLGMDAFLEIDTWKAYEELLRAVDLIVARRPGAGGREGLEAFLRSRLSGGYEFDPSVPAYRHPERRSVLPFEGSLLDISATRIRETVRAGRSIQFLVPEAVENYILSKGFYR